jgi:hypothetical protein
MNWTDESTKQQRYVANEKKVAEESTKARFFSMSLRTPFSTAWGKYLIGSKELHRFWKEMSLILHIGEEAQESVRSMINDTLLVNTVR